MKYYKEVKASEELPKEIDTYFTNLGPMLFNPKDGIWMNPLRFRRSKYVVYVWLKPITKDELLREDLEKAMIFARQGSTYHNDNNVWWKFDIDSIKECITEYLNQK